MIVDDVVDRFQSNWGIQPTSIALMNDYTTKIGAENIELAGKDFSSEGDFGDGLTGLGGLGDLEDTLHSAFDITGLFVWPITLYLVYSLFQAGTKSEPAKRRKAAIGKARAELKEAKKMSRFGSLV